MNNTCGTCRHSSPNTPELECAKRPGWATWEGGACEDWAESNWQRYFGNPERAAKFMRELCLESDTCTLCPLEIERSCPYHAASFIEWMEADAE